MIKDTKQGYTLVELLFVMGMIFLLAAMSLINYNQFGREVELENDTYDMALTVRTAQFFGINRQDDLSDSFDDPKPYGVYFNIGVSAPVLGITPQSFMMFIDNDGGPNDTNNLFDDIDVTGGQTPLCVSNNATECLDIFTLRKGNYISGMCAGASEADCDSEADRAANAVEELHITFTRPNPDATIKADALTDFAYAEITVSNDITGVGLRRIAVGTAGQISIK